VTSTEAEYEADFTNGFRVSKRGNLYRMWDGSLLCVYSCSRGYGYRISDPDDDEARMLFLQEMLEDADRRRLLNDRTYARREALKFWLS
jgi:hypothetical protein